MAASFKAYETGAEFSAPENIDTYLAPKKLAPRYRMAYSTFMKFLQEIIDKVDYPERAFWVKRGDPLKRKHVRIEIHSILGVAFLDSYFYARRRLNAAA